MSEAASALSSGERVANYQILGMLGAGGMGVVYKALDIKLQRTVALKFLPPDINASEKDKERFLKEARTASSLDHAHIGVIHGIEDTPDGRSFIVMAYYEGETLAQKIRRGPLPFREAVDTALQITQGLAEAHAHNIVHRDIIYGHDHSRLRRRRPEVVRSATRLYYLLDLAVAATCSQSLPVVEPPRPHRLHLFR